MGARDESKNYSHDGGCRLVVEEGLAQGEGRCAGKDLGKIGISGGEGDMQENIRVEGGIAMVCRCAGRQ